MLQDKGTLLLSLKPRFASLILDGTKTVELRRIAPKINPGHNALLYASSPVRKLVGTCRVVDVVVDSKAEIWNRFGRQCALTEEEYEEYFDGAKHAVAIIIDTPQRLQESPSLAAMRNRLSGFSPPQSFRYLSTNMLRALEIHG